jgi:hypothetical protein
VPIQNIESIAVASNDKYGNTFIQRIFPGRKEQQKEETLTNEISAAS